jgi:hypothetical protein
MLLPLISSFNVSLILSMSFVRQKKIISNNDFKKDERRS